MIPYLGDFLEDDTVYIGFNTFSSDDPSASVTITNLADADLKVHKDGAIAQLVTDGATIAIDYDGITGNHLATIDTSAHADYAVGSDYHVRMEGTTVDGATINAWIGCFSIENRSVTRAAVSDIKSALVVTDAVVDTIYSDTTHLHSDSIKVESSIDVVESRASQIISDTTHIHSDTIVIEAFGTPPTVAAIADGVWDELTTDHIAVNTFGQRLSVSETGTAAAATSTTLTLDAGSSELADFYNGCILVITAGTGAGQSRIIEDYAVTTNVATVATWVTTPSTDSVYYIVPFGTIPGTSAPTAAQVADAVWNELITGHDSAGMAGSQLWTNINAIASDSIKVESSIDVIESRASQIISDTTEIFSDTTAIEAFGTPPTVAAIADGVWDELITGHNSAGKAGSQLWTNIDAILTDTANIDANVTISQSEISQILSDTTVIEAFGAPPTAAVNADAVWNEAMADHVALGSFGEGISDIESNLVIIDTVVDAILVDTGTTLDNAISDVKSALVVVDTVVDTIASDLILAQTDLDTLTSDIVLIDQDTSDIKATLVTVASDAAAIEVDTGTTLSAQITTIASDIVLLDTAVVVARGAAEGVPTSTVIQTDLPEATDDHYNNMVFAMTSGNEAGEVRRISDYTGVTGTITLATALSGAPTATETFVIMGTAVAAAAGSLTAEAVADAVWDELITGHNSAGKAGSQLWTNINSIASDSIKVESSIDVIESKVSQIYSDTTHIHSDTIVIEGATAPTAAAIADAVWDELITGHNTAGKAGSQLWTNINSIASDSIKVESSIDVIESKVSAIYSDTTHIHSDTTAIEAFGTPPTVAAIADGVWDEAMAGHVALGSFGEGISDIESNLVIIDTVVDTILVDTGTTLDNAVSDVKSALVVVDGIVDAILVDTGTTLSAQVTTIASDLVLAQTDLDTLTSDTAAIEVDTGTTLSAQITTIASDIKLVESSVSQILSDTTVIEAAGGASAADIADAVWNETATGHVGAGAAGSQLWTDIDAILTDTGTTLSAQVTTIASDLVLAQADLDTIYSDTTKIHSDTTVLEAATAPTAAAIADAVWDEVVTGHNTAGKAGSQLWTNIDSIHSDTTKIHSDTTVIESQTTVIESKAIEIESDTTSIHSQTTVIESDSIKVESSVDVIESQVSKIYSDTTAINAAVGTLFDGTADSGSTTTLVDTELTQATDDHWVGNLIKFTSTTLDGQTARITGFVAATDTLTFEPALTVSVATHTYSIIPWQDGLLVAEKSALTKILSEVDVIQSDIALVDSQVTATDAVVDTIYSDTTHIHSDTTIATSALSDIESFLLLIDSAVTVIDDLLDTEIPALTSNMVHVKSDTAAIEADTNQIISDTSLIKSDLVVLTTNVAAVDSQVTATDSQLTVTDAVVDTIYSDTTIVVQVTSDIESNLVTVKSDVLTVDSQLTVTDTAVDAIQTAVDSQSTKIYSDTTVIEATGASLTVAQDSKLTEVHGDVNTIDAATTPGISDIKSALVVTDAVVDTIYSDTTIIASDLKLVESSVSKILSDTTAIESDLEIANSEQSQILSDTAAIHSQTTVIESKVVEIESDTTAIHSKVVEIESDTTAIHTQTTTIASDLVLAQADLDTVTSDLVVIDALLSPEISDILSKVLIIQSDTSDIKSKLVVIDSDLSKLASDLVIVDSGVNVIQSDVVKISSDISAVPFQKNAALLNFQFEMVDATDFQTPETGISVTATRSIDNAAFAACANSAAELSNGIYAINLDATDMNGDVITFRFTGTGCADRFITIHTSA